MNEPGKKLIFRIQLVTNKGFNYVISKVLYTFIGFFTESSLATDGGFGVSSAANPENTSIREGKRGVICSMISI